MTMIGRLLKLLGLKGELSVSDPINQAQNFTERTERLIDTITASAEEHALVADGLQKYCAETRQYMDGECPERFIIAILKLSIQSGFFQEQDFSGALDLAKLDYRDLLMAAGFGHDVYLHNEWAKERLQDA